jgi:alkylation response protein AidB-like acyl-CoA dehydrogenase
VTQFIDVKNELNEATGKFLDGEWSLESAREWNGDTGGFLDLWAKAGDLGWFVASAPESSGGLGFGIFETIGIFEQAGYHLMPGPLLENVVLRNLVTPLSQRPISEAAMVSLAWSSGRVGETDADTVQLVDGRLSGSVEAVECGDLADEVLVIVDVSGLPVIAMVRRETNGVSTTLKFSPDVIARPVQVHFDNVLPEWVIDDAEKAGAFLEDLATLGMLTVSAELIGLSRRVLDMTVEYAKNRIQFDRPIGSFQAIQHILAEMLVDVSIASTMLTETARGMESSSSSVQSSVRSLKWFANTISKSVTEQSLQVHGGIGFADEYPLGTMLKRTLYLRRCWGGERFQAITLGENLLGLSDEHGRK